MDTLSSFFLGGGHNPGKAFTVRGVSRETGRTEIVASNFEELVSKGKDKLKIPNDESVKVLLEDGTEVDGSHYLLSLPSKTSLMIIADGDYGDLMKVFLTQFTCDKKQAETVSQLKKMQSDPSLGPEMTQKLSEIEEVVDTNIEAESKADDVNWFQGLDEKYQTKSAYMRNSAQGRIRSYYRDAQKIINEEEDPIVRNVLLKALERTKPILKTEDHHGHYFDRRANAPREAMCDNRGWFNCQGPWNSDNCSNLHRINPYASHVSRKRFSQWNLDHIIEKSRVVMPTLISAAKNVPDGRTLNAEKLHSLLFTRENLKLVYIDCHEKSARPTNTINLQDFYC